MSLTKVRVNTGAVEGHGTASAQGASADVCRGNAQRGTVECRALAKGPSEMGSQDGSGALRSEDRVQRGAGRGVVAPKVEDTPADSSHRLKKSIGSEAMGDGLIAFAILLGCEAK